MTATLIGSAFATALAGCGLGEWLRSRRSTRSRKAAIEAWLERDSTSRDERLAGLTGSDPSNSLAWYFRGCSAFRSRDFAAAARYFGMAHHRDPDLLSAALLTFTALKSASNDGRHIDRWLRELIETSREMNLSHTALDRGDEVTTLLDPQFSAAPDALSSLGRLAWLVDNPSGDHAVRDVMEQRPGWAAPLFRN